MKNLQKGSIAPTLIIIGILLIGGVYFYFSQKSISNHAKDREVIPMDMSDKYSLYINSDAGYQVELPVSWDKYKEGSNLFVFPTINNNGGEISIDGIYKNNKVGLTIMSMTLPSKEKLDDFYSKFYKNLKEEDFSPKSEDIILIKSANLPISEIDDPTYGYIGKEYAIKANNHIYVVNIFYKDDTYKISQEDNIKRIITTLKEIQ